MRCSLCNTYVPPWLWVGDDHPVIVSGKDAMLYRDDKIEQNQVKITMETVVSIQMCKDVNKPKTDSDFIDIGPECFADRQALVISYKGENYYKACGKFIHQLQNGTRTHCVKRVGHFNDCEDYDGTTRNHLHPSDSGIPRSSR